MLAERILRSEASILRLIVLDEQGNVLGGSPSSQIESFRSAAGKELKHFGRAVAVIHGVGSKAEKYYGDLDYVVYAFKNNKVLIVHLYPLCLVLAVVLKRMASEARVLSSIALAVGNGRGAR